MSQHEDLTGAETEGVAALEMPDEYYSHVEDDNPGAALGDNQQSFSDDELALAFSDRHDGQALFVSAWNDWLIWDCCRWRADDTLLHYDLVRKICRTAASTSRLPGEKKRLRSAQTIAAVERIAKTDPRHARSPDAFDADPWALNTPGGVVNLQTGRRRAHRTDDMHTKVTGATPGGDCPRWLHFLNEITRGDSDLIGYLQRWAGYSLTGIIREEAFLFLCGPGGNGKSVLLNTLAKVMGDYAKTASSDVFTVTRNEQHPTHVANLRGARMVLVSEVEEGKPWAESRIKSLTGGDKISARVMRGDLFEFAPQFKLWIAGNHRPALKNPDDAMKRRLHMVPLTYVPTKPDLRLAEALAAELPGILGWAIEGCLDWQRDGLGMPTVVRDASAEYFAEQDAIATWMGERCEKVEHMTVASSALFRDFQAFTKARGDDPRGQTWFSEGLQRHFAKKRGGGGMVFVGLRLLPADPGNWA